MTVQDKEVLMTQIDPTHGVNKTGLTLVAFRNFPQPPR